ncbi:hypothetical protein EW146_g4804 [Bondarzewia mesenterica]|uniref:Uncharacterized protein n=1 Tax=Bondarzewia mesenterica TaxID=1095465 RepID=A0A4S4LTX6_9AGAM|nr:hypothetical protein EW146_g4804 [Bondarzewia mesenterica]
MLTVTEVEVMEVCSELVDFVMLRGSEGLEMEEDMIDTVVVWELKMDVLKLTREVEGDAEVTETKVMHNSEDEFAEKVTYCGMLLMMSDLRGDGWESRAANALVECYVLEKGPEKSWIGITYKMCFPSITFAIPTEHEFMRSGGSAMGEIHYAPLTFHQRIIITEIKQPKSEKGLPVLCFTFKV